jgi:hypothetical protein
MSTIIFNRKGKVVPDQLASVQDYPWGCIKYEDGKWFQSTRGICKELYWNPVNVRHIPKAVRATALVMS